MTEAIPDAFRHVTANPELCSSETVQKLRLFLDGDGHRGKPLDSQPLVEKSVKSAKSTSRPGKTRSGPLLKHGATHVNTGRVLSSTQKRTLATQFVNVSLQKISRATPPPKDRAVTHPGAGEQPSKVKLGSKQPKSSTSAAVDDSINLQAWTQCGVIAFAALDRLAEVNTKAESTEDLKLEKGLIAFASRLVHIESLDAASSAMCLIHSRILRRSAQSAGSSKAVKALQAQNSISQSTSTILDWLSSSQGLSISPASAAICLEFLIPVLRLLSKQGKSEMQVQASAILDSGRDTSPCLLAEILRGSKETCTTALRTFEQVLEAMESLAMKLAVHKETSEKSAAFHWVSTLLKNRMRGASIMTKEYDAAATWSAFTKVYTQATRTIGPESNVFLRTARQTFLDLEAYSLRLTLSADVPNHLYWHLSQLARDAGDIDEALFWTERQVESPSAESLSRARHCSLRLQHAALSLAADREDSASTVAQAAGLVGCSMSGSASDVRHLFREAIMLATMIARYSKKLSAFAKADHGSLAGASVYFDALRAIIRFTIKFVDHQAGTTGDPLSSKLRQEHQEVLKEVQSSIDGLINLLRMLQVWGRADWPTLAGCSNECSALALKFDEKSQSATCGDAASAEIALYADVCLKFSDVFWTSYTAEKEDQTDQHRLKSLSKSCSILSDAPPDIKRRGGLPFKLHRLGRHLRKTGIRKEAHQALDDCLRVSIELGTFDKIHIGTIPKPFDMVDESPPMKIFFSALKTWIDIHLERERCVPEWPFISRSLDTEIQGALFEWQLSYLDKVPQLSDHAIAFRLSLVQHALSLYDEEQRPLRRRRLLSQYLRNTSCASSGPEHEQIVEDAKRLACLRCTDLGDDSPLSPYLSDYQACLLLVSGLQDSAHASDFFAEAINQWRALCGKDQHGPRSAMDDPLQRWQDLELIASYYSMIGDMQSAASAHLVQLQLAQEQLSQHITLALKSSVSLASCLMDCGYALEASRYLSLQKDVVSQVEEADEVKLEIRLTEARNALLLSHPCSDPLLGLETPKLPQPCKTNSDKTLALSSAASAAQSALLEAKVLDYQCHQELYSGDLTQALTLSKQALRKIQRCWKGVEGQHRAAHHALPALSQDDVADTFSKLSVTENQATRSTMKLTFGPMHWPLVPALWRYGLQVADLATRCGFRHEALMAEKEALKLAEAMPTPGLLTKIQAMCRLNAARAQEQFSADVIELTDGLRQGQTRSREMINIHLAIGSYYDVKGEAKLASEAYHDAKQAVENAAPWCVEKPDRGPDRLKPDGLSVAKQAKKPQSTAKKTKLKTKGARGGSPVEQPSRRLTEPILSELALLIHLQIARNLLAQGLVKEAFQKISQSRSIDHPESRHDTHSWTVQAAVLADQAFEAFSRDSVLSMLSESTLAYPAIDRPLLSDKEKAIKMLSGLTVQDQEGTNVARLTSSDPPALVQGSLQLALQVIGHAQAAPNPSLTETRSTIAKIATILSLPDVGGGQSLVPIAAIPNALELPQDIAAHRERSIIESHKAIKQGDAEDELDHSEQIDSPLLRPQDAAPMPDMLPAPWTVLSLSVSDDSRHIHVRRYRNGEEPFIMQLPLSRQHEDECDSDAEGDFMFNDVCTTLKDIVAASDETIQEAKDPATNFEDKTVKSTWWTKREHLDLQLKDCLQNIEKLWFGGFRGIFSQINPDPDHLSRFQTSVDSMLSKYLPSRSGRRRDSQPLKFDQRIYELLLNVGNPDGDEDELENELMDLLYFLVDILQFHREANAYDEIDFDAMVVELQDALRSYYQSVPERSDSADTHLILVLDKPLHAIPWESMPCLQSKSVSRMPSVYEVRERLRFMQQQRDSGLQHATNGVQVNRDHGSFILNPGNDIPKTETAFKNPLSTLQTWSNITRRRPTESEFETSLTPSDDAITPHALLYFGHGSGMQYIRGKKIKALRCPNNTRSKNAAAGPTCAVPLLFGCSSAHQTYAGQFNNYGTPLTYLIGGAPAVLGALWDVTDGDCDAFARGVLTRWGLVDRTKFEEADAEKKQKRRLAARKGRGKKVVVGQGEAEKEGRTDYCLSEACARSRGDCYLRYLNGAAMVVYGVPVYLGP